MLLDGQEECNGGSPPVPQPTPEPESSVNPPNIEPLGGVFSAPVTVTLSSVDGGTIYYTLDGSAPSSASLEYTGPVVVTDTSEIRSIAQVADGTTSSESQAAYVFGAFYVEDDWTSVALTPLSLIHI